MGEEHLRIGDAEREQAATALGEHYAQGRITADEHADRLEQVWSARTRADLQPLFRDLPGAPRAPQRAPRAFRSRSGRGPLFLVLGILLVLTVITHVPFLLIGFLAVVLVLARRRHRYAAHRWTGQAGHWSR